MRLLADLYYSNNTRCHS